MAFNPAMNDAVSGEPASSSDYNLLIDNILDLDTRVTTATATDTTQNTNISALQTLTGDATKGNNALNTRVSALEGASAAVGAWTNCTLSSPWSNRLGAQYYALKVRTLPGGNIQINGNLLRSSSGGAVGEQVAVLPNATFYPPKEVMIPVVDSGANARYLRIDTAGNIYLYNAAAISITVLNIVGTYPGASSGAS